MKPRAPLDPELARRVTALTVRARKAVEGTLTGMHKSPHRGASVVFVEHREYRPGDDPRLLDWHAFARTDRHSIKRFEQETQLRASLVLDQSGSMHYGHDPSKLEHGATLLGALAYILVNQGDAVGAMLLDEEVRERVGARSRPAHLDVVLGTLASPAEPGSHTDLATALRQVAERAGSRGVLVIASDLLDGAEEALRPLATLVSRGNEVVVLHVMHPDELDFPFRGPTRFYGLEGEPALDTDASAVRRGYLAELRAFLDARRAQVVGAGARYALARTDEAPERTLAALLARSRGRGG